MTTERDAEGRIVVAELERRISIADAEIVNIGLEKKSLLDKMKASLEIGEQVNNDDTEIARLKNEIENLTIEKEKLENEQKDRNKNIAEIEAKKAELSEEAKKLGTGTINTAELDKLRADKKAIEAEVVDLIDNPKKAEIRKQIEEIIML